MKKGCVSIWNGYFKSEEDLENFIERKYNDDGEANDSIFQTVFELDYYDEDNLEMEFYTKTSNNLRELLADISFEEKIIPKLIKERGEKLDYEFNTIILTYNFNYTGTITEYITDDNQLNYISTIEYEY